MFGTLWLCFFGFICYSNCWAVVDRNVYPTTTQQYLPEWDSLDARPLPKWYDEAKIGIFIHWGVFSVPKHGTEWFWYNWREKKAPSYVNYMKKNYPQHFTYQDFAREFTAELYNPDDWAELFKASGAKYVVFTSKHHEGYTMWPSKYSFSWNSMDIGPQRDLLGEFANAIRSRTTLKFGIYHSLYEWFNPLYIKDRNSTWTEEDFVVQKTMPELQELVNEYKPEIIWSDGEWEAPDTYWGSKTFLAWLYNSSPVKETVVVNDRWGHETLCKHGDFYTCSDRFNPGVLQKHKWENAMTIDRKSWGYRYEAALSDYLTIEELIRDIVSTVSCGGNILMNVGPTKEGLIIPLYQERLLQVGRWLEINGVAIYETMPWKIQNDTITNTVWYTYKPEDSNVYAIMLKWPKDSDYVYLKYDGEAFSNHTKIFLVNKNEDLPLEWTIIMAEDVGKVEITLPNFALADSKWGWTLKIKNPKLIRR